MLKGSFTINKESCTMRNFEVSGTPALICAEILALVHAIEDGITQNLEPDEKKMFVELIEFAMSIYKSAKESDDEEEDEDEEE